MNTHPRPHFENGLGAPREPAACRLKLDLLRNAILTGALFLAATSPAAVKTWDGSTSASWINGNNWTPFGAPGDGDDLIFPAGAPNLANNNDITDLRVDSIQFNGAAGGYALTGNAITVSNGVVAAHTLGLNSINLSTVTNASAQTYTVDSGGTLDVNANIVLLGGFTLSVNNDFTTRLLGAISGTGRLNKTIAGTGILRLGSLVDNTFTGTTTVSGGALQLDDSAGATAIMVPGDLFINSAGTVTLLENNQIADTADVTVNGLLNLNNFNETIATLTITGGSVTTGTGTLTNGNITALASATTATISGNLHLGGSTRTFSVADGTAAPELTISALISGGNGGSPLFIPAGFTKTGAGTLLLSDANTYGGPTTVNDGTLQLNNNLALGGTFSLFGSSATFVNSNAVLLLNNAHVTNEVLTLNSVNPLGALQVNATGDWIGNIVLNTNVVIEASSLLQLGGLISGTGGFTKIGANTLRLIGTNINSYAGDTIVNGGLLELNVNANNGAIPGDLTINGAFTVRLLDSDQFNNSAIITINTGGLLDVNGFSDIVGGLVMTGGTAQSGAGLLRLNGNVTVNPSSTQSTITGELQLFGSSIRQFNISGGVANPDLDISAIISGNGGLTVNNSLVQFSRVVISGANTYAGLTTFNNDGSVDLQNASALGSTAAGTVLNGPNMVVRDVIVGEGLTNNSPSTLQGTTATGWTGPIVLNATLNLQVEGPLYTLDLSGVISGNGAITKSGANFGTVIFSGASANTYTGDTLVQEGTLELAKSAGAAIPSGTLTIGDGEGGVGADVVRELAPGFQIGTIPIVLNGSGRLDLNGQDDTVGALTFNGGDVTTGAGTLFMAGNANVPSTITNISTVTGNLSLGSLTRTFNVTNGSTGVELSISASVVGTGGLIKNGSGFMSLNSSNAFSGAVTVNDGFLALGDSFSVGTTAGGVTVNGDAVLQLQSSSLVGAEALMMNSTASGAFRTSDTTSNAWAGTITLQSDTSVSVLSSPGSLNLSGAIGGPGALTKTGTGTLYFSGATANDYAGITTVNSGTLVLDKDISNVAMTNDLVIGDGVGGVDADVVRTLSRPQLPSSVGVTLNSSGRLELNADEDFGSLAGSGNVVINVAPPFGASPGYDGGTTTFSGLISGVGSLHKHGTGTMMLTGNNTYTGDTEVNGGTLVVDGSQPQSPVAVNATGILGGSGTVGHITSTLGGLVSPGASPGVLTCSNVVFSGATSDFTVELNGAIPGPGHDLLRARGTVSLGSSTLNASVGGGFAPVEGQSLIVLANDGGEAIAGTFNGLAEGAVLTAGNLKFRVSYLGGTGNDVSLTLTNPPLKGTVATVSGGNGNGAIDPNECDQLLLVITNTSGVAISGISATLSTTTDHVIVTQPDSTYPDIANNGRGTNTTPFQITTLPAFPCASNITLVLTVNSSIGNFASLFTLPSGSPGIPVAFSNDTFTGIADSSLTYSTNGVSGISLPIAKVTVSMYVTHTNVGDLAFRLFAPDGSGTLLTAFNGATGDDYGIDCAPARRTTFDDSAVTSITAGAAPFVGTFRPQGSLAVFNGKSGPGVNGNWRLELEDDFAGTAGTLRCWTLTITPVACTDGGGFCETCPGSVTNAVTGSDPSNPDRISRSGLVQACPAPVACQGAFNLNGPFKYDTHVFTNAGGPACITVFLSSPCGDALTASAYMGSYHPTNVCQNFLGEMGSIPSSAFDSFSVNVPGATNFVIVVNEVYGGSGCEYTLVTTGTECPPPVLHITPANPTEVRLDWTTTAGGYLLERTNTLVSGVPVWPMVTNQPVVDSGRFAVTNAAAGSNNFYRLRKP